MNVRRFLELALYIVLLIPALVFVHNYVVEYLEAKTIFIETSVPITVEDVPAVTFCFWYNKEQYDNMTHSELTSHFDLEGEYMKEVEIRFNSLKLTDQYYYPSGGVWDPYFYLTLNDDFNQSSLRFFDFFEITLEQMHLIRDKRLLAPDSRLDTCFRVTGKSNQSVRNLPTNDFHLSIDIDFPHFTRIKGTNDFADAKVPTNGYFIVSTEGNSYGIGTRIWFDGEVQLVPWNVGDMLFVKIVDVTEYHFLGSNCSRLSYYQCLADRFAKFESDSFLQKKWKSDCKDDEDPKWYVNKKCSPILLPFTSNKIRSCYTWQERNCYRYVIGELLKDQEEHCKSPCTIKEYKIETTRSQNDMEKVIPNQLKAQFKYSLPATTFKKHMTNKLLNKTIKTETYLITGLALLGNVGGILGIFVGFSFMGVSDWIMTGFGKIWNRYKHIIRRSTIDLEEANPHLMMEMPHEISQNQKITTVHHNSTVH